MQSLSGRKMSVGKRCLSGKEKKIFFFNNNLVSIETK
jgi:hypothetical protein